MTETETDSNQNCGLTFGQLIQACKNVGVDLECDKCCAIFFTGFAMPWDKHNNSCPLPNSEIVVTVGPKANED